MFNLLQGLRVIDLTSVVLGPYATQFLGDFGADVIKVEPLAGDLFRYVRPGRSQKMGAGYLNLNRNKRSVALDLKTESGKKVMAEILADADVLVHNMRPAALKRLGLDYETLSKDHPRLVYCVAAGFGKDGRNAEKPAYDDVIQAASGLAYLNTNEQGEPRFLPTIVCDKVGGLHLAMAVLAGTAYQARTGKGCFIEAPMFESMVSFLMVEQMAGRSFTPPLGGIGYDRLLSPYRRPFKTKDGFIALLPYNSQHWANFLEFIGRDDIAHADWVQDSAKRSENINTLYEIVSQVMPQRTSNDWLSHLHRLDIPCTLVNKLEELFDDDHLRDVDFFPETDHPTEGKLNMVRSPFRVHGVEELPDKHAPELGENNDNPTWENSR